MPEPKVMKFEWIDNPDQVGEMNFTFDGKEIFNLHQDYPHKLSKEQKELFDRENPFWAEFFKDKSN